LRVAITGVGGFIGSTTAEQAVIAGHEVIGFESFRPDYDPALKLANLVGLSGNEAFTLVEGDLRQKPLEALLDGVDVVLHLAARAGVRPSWDELGEYVDTNVTMTIQLLEAAAAVGVGRFVCASSSSVYGHGTGGPSSEDQPLNPVSPYAASKLMAEHVVRMFGERAGIDTVLMRYFTVYGPRQRPDMAFHRAITAALTGTEFVLLGDGLQRRDFTFIDDTARANLAALVRPIPSGTAINVGGGCSVNMLEVLAAIGDELGRPVPVRMADRAAGDAIATLADTRRCEDLLGFRPEVSLADGIAAQRRWLERSHESAFEDAA
jgi:UDP-glucuronate 4-epimerase